jgi:hypothetical protein
VAIVGITAMIRHYRLLANETEPVVVIDHEFALDASELSI